MELTYTSVALFVTDIERSKEFYTNVLNLPIELDFGKNVILKGGIAIWEIDKKHIITKELNIESHSSERSNRFELYFETTNIEEVASSLKENGVLFLHDIHEEAWGQRTIRFFDPDKHLIEIGEGMEVFIRRFYNMGMSAEEVAERTSVPVAEVNRLLAE